MKYIFKLTLVFLLTQTFISCDELNLASEENIDMEDDFNLVEINNLYGMKIPKYMKEVNDLNDEASLQYQNIYKETYVIVIEEGKEEFINIFKDLDEYNSSISIAKNYRDIQLNYLYEGMIEHQENDTKSFKINGMDAEFVQVDGSLEDVETDIAYFLTYVEGKDNVYMIMAWTLKDRKEKYRSTFNKLAQSFYLVK